MNRFAIALVATSLAGPSLAATYDSVALFSADPLAAGAVTNGFETATRSGPVISFGTGSATCVAASATTFCPPTPMNGSGNAPFFGLSLGTDAGFPIPEASLSGVNAPYFSSPDSLRFTFDQALTAFGIFIGGLGDVGTGTTLAGSLSTGEAFTVVANFAVDPDFDPRNVFTGNTRFFGITSETPFTTVTFTTASTSPDGIFLDDMITASVSGGGGGSGGGGSGGGDTPEVIPLPASALLLLAGIGGLAALRRRRGA